VLDYLGWFNGVVVDSGQFQYNGGFSQLPSTIPTDTTYNRSPVPLPPTLLLLGSGLVGLALLRRRQPATV